MNSNGKITAPVSVQDPYTCMGVGKQGDYYDVGYICSNAHGKINKWALKKPITFPAVFDITLDNIKSKYCGLSPAANNTLLQSLANYTGNSVNNSVAQVESSQKEWAYAPPTGGDQSPYRLTDFIDYNTAAKAPDSGWRNFDLTESELNSYANTGIESTAAPDGNVNDWAVNNTFGALPYFNLKFDAPSYAVVGDGGGVEIPITWITGDRLIASEYWRIAFAVYIPSIGTTGKWQLFTSRRTLKSSTSFDDIAACIPSLATNTLAIQQMLSDGAKSFKAIPCLVKNAKIGFSAISENKLRSHIIAGGDTVIYSMPSGQKSISINIVNTSNIPSVSGVTSYGCSKNRQWVIGTVTVGYTSSYVPIIGIVIVKTAPVTVDTEVIVNFNYTILIDGKPSQRSMEFWQSIKANTTLHVNDKILYGVYAVAPQPGTTILKDSIEWINP